MKIPFFREFNGKDEKDAVKYLKNENQANLRELSTLLSRIDLTNNFQGWTVQVTILGNSELPIRNEFRDGTIPSSRIILRGDQYSYQVTDGTTAWTKDWVYLKNNNANATIITVVFLK